MKKILLFLLALVFVTIGVATTFAAGIVLSPPKFEFDADPGATIRGVIKITNQNDTALTLASEVQDFVAGGETGTPSFVKSSDPAISIAPWVKVGTGAPLTLGSGKMVEIPFTISVPSDAEPGGHYGAIFFSPPSGAGQIGVAQRIGALLLVRVKGEIIEKLTLTDFAAYKTMLEKISNPDAIDKISTSSFFGSTPVAFAIRLNNEGNVHTKPTGKIEISRFGSLLTEIGVKTITNENGVPMSQEITDYLPVNDARGNVLAKSARRFDTAYQGAAFWYTKEDGTKEIRYRGFPIGYYTAKLTLNYGANQTPITSETSFVIFPWQEIFGGLFLLVALGYGFIKYRKYSHERLRRKFREEMRKEKN